MGQVASALFTRAMRFASPNALIALSRPVLRADSHAAVATEDIGPSGAGVLRVKGSSARRWLSRKFGACEISCLERIAKRQSQRTAPRGPVRVCDLYRTRRVTGRCESPQRCGVVGSPIARSAGHWLCAARIALLWHGSEEL